MTTPEQGRKYGGLTNQELADDADTQIAYILGALGLLDTYDGCDSLREGLTSARKGNLWAILDMLRQIKMATRALVANSKSHPTSACEPACYRKGGHLHGLED